MWRWLRPYGAWLARAKDFLWPENWLRPELRLEGHVRDGDGRAVSFVLVRAVAVGAQAEDPLGEATTDARGRYEITAPARRVGSEVRVSVFDDAGALVASAPIVFDVSAEQTVDVTL